MNKKIGAFITCVILTALAFSDGVPFAMEYVDSPPLANVIVAKVGSVKSGPRVQVPIITWGGDVATIVANGNSKITTPNSIFARKNLNIKLVREDDFKKQIAAYIKGESPYLRGTLGMIDMAAELLSRDPATKPVIIYLLTWSTGGDSLVVKSGIDSVHQLKGKTIAVQAYGPHVSLITEVLRDANLSIKDINLKWTSDLTGTENTPMKALYSQDVDAATVITPDAMTLTSQGKVGTGTEGSVKGARILFSTKTATRIIADVYAVRADYLKNHRREVQAFVHSLMLATEELEDLQSAREGPKQKEYKDAITAAAEILLDSPQASADVEGLLGDCEFVGYKGNVRFFTDVAFQRGLEKLNEAIQTDLAALNLISKKTELEKANWQYNDFKDGLRRMFAVEAEKFDPEKVKELETKIRHGKVGEGLFTFSILFLPNQDTFSSDMYGEQFSKALKLAATYGGAIITVEGHSDPLQYLLQKKEGAPEAVVKQLRDATRELSRQRAVSVRDSLINFAKEKGLEIDASQFAVVGQGIDKPKSGMCGLDPCPPKDERQWKENMRVDFQLRQVETEAPMFKKLN